MLWPAKISDGQRRSADRGNWLRRIVADKAFVSNAMIANLNERGAKIVISQHPWRALPLRLHTELYKWRHLIENFFCEFKEFRTLRDAGRQNRLKLRSHHPPRRSRDKLTISLVMH